MRVPRVDDDTFLNDKELLDELRRYASAIGFGVRVDKTWPGYKKFACERSGRAYLKSIYSAKDNEDDAIRDFFALNSRQCGCPWHVLAKENKSNGIWRV